MPVIRLKRYHPDAILPEKAVELPFGMPEVEPVRSIPEYCAAYLRATALGYRFFSLLEYDLAPLPVPNLKYEDPTGQGLAIGTEGHIKLETGWAVQLPPGWEMYVRGPVNKPIEGLEIEEGVILNSYGGILTLIARPLHEMHISRGQWIGTMIPMQRVSWPFEEVEALEDRGWKQPASFPTVADYDRWAFAHLKQLENVRRRKNPD